jgi:hypothetical protein
MKTLTTIYSSKPKHMKKLVVLVIVTALIGMWACKKDEEVKTTDLQIWVAYPELYAQELATGASVELTNMETQTKTTLTTGANGGVVFENLLPGTYSLLANINLSESQAEELIGISQELFLSGTVVNYIVTGVPLQELTVQLIGGRAGDLVFKEIYYTGSRTPAGGSYFLDQFYEIYNNSTETIYADGLILATAMPMAATTSIVGWSDDPDHIYLSSVWRVPGDGTQHPIAPGESFIISQNGTNHREDPNGNANCPYPGSIADFETFVDREDTRDVDNPGVPNMEMLHHGSMFYFLATVFGPGVVIFRVDDFSALPLMTQPGSTSTATYVQLPSEYVIDGVDLGRDENQVQFKRFPPSIDAGMIWCSGSYVGESVRRKTSKTIDGRRILQDTNNTTNDFEVLTTPTPKSFD